MYYADLSTIPNSWHGSVLSGKAVGWLSCEYSYPKGKIASGFLERLSIFCCSSHIYYMGYHYCEFCNGPKSNNWNWREMIDDTPSMKLPTCGDNRHCLGSGDILIFGPGDVYIAPNMIYHYVADHDYLPPDEFIQAVLFSPLPDSAEYHARTIEYYHGKP